MSEEEKEITAMGKVGCIKREQKGGSLLKVHPWAAVGPGYKGN